MSAFWFAVLVALVATPLCNGGSWAERQPIGTEMGAATCEQAKVYGCVDEIEQLIETRYAMTCDVFVHTNLSDVPCCLYRASNCKEMRRCVVRDVR